MEEPLPVIVQITAVIENETLEDGTQRPYNDATVYGLSRDGNLFYWAVTSTEKDGTEVYGWKPSGQ